MSDFQDLMIIIVVVGVFALIFMIASAIAGAKIAANKMLSDDDKEEVVLQGKVLEKTTEKQNVGSIGIKLEMTTDWILFEDVNGVRRRLRNIKVKEIMLTPGDRGIMVIRGETIYGFTKAE